MKNVTILGSTGSIGVNALDVIANHPEKFKVRALAAGRNVRLLARQIEEFKPDVVSVYSSEEALKLQSILKSTKRISILYDQTGVRELAACPDTDIVISAISGAAGLEPTLAAINSGRDIALANKETMVIAGQLVTRQAIKNNVRILPVDSEHSAIFQCLAGGQNIQSLHRIILTASGGPFFKLTAKEMKKVTLDQALIHPRWKMGRKITIDSASMMNKGLEVIEAKWLFDLDIGHIDVLIHPQSIVHSLIELVDGSVLAQLGIADMRVPIAYALTYPERMPSGLPYLNLTKAGPLDFYPPDMKKFPCLRLAYEVGNSGGTAPAVLNAANEVAVDAFLNNRIGFNDIPKVIDIVLDKHDVQHDPSLENILHADCEARQQAQNVIKKIMKG
jgi:1-deoxy-D-xylulose-5-phosphate reductoisomerase